MSEEKLNHIEEMLSQLINAVGTIMEEQTEMRADMSSMRTVIDGMRTDINTIHTDIDGMRTDINTVHTDIDGMRTDIQKLQNGQHSIRNENEVRHHEIMRRFGRIEADQTYTWKKAVENEREINMLKSKAN